MKAQVTITKEMIFLIIIGIILLFIALYIGGFLTLKTSAGFLENASESMKIKPLR